MFKWKKWTKQEKLSRKVSKKKGKLQKKRSRKGKEE